MKLSEAARSIDAEILYDFSQGELQINDCCGADLMSDVMSFAKSDVMLLTGLINPQVIRTAEMMDIKAIAFVRGKRPTEAMIELARELRIAILVTKYPMFESCGRLYKLCREM